MAMTTNRRLRPVRLVLAYLLISVAALWLAEGDASSTPSFIYQAF